MPTIKPYTARPWHDADTLSTIRQSGGLEEPLWLPIMMVLPGVVLGSIGGVAESVLRRMRAVTLNSCSSNSAVLASP
jgi:hypothetical protein